MIILIKNYLSMTPIWKSTIKDCANLRKSFEMHAHPQYNSYPPNEPTSTYSEQRGDWSRCPTCWRRRWASWGPGGGPCSCCAAWTCMRTPHTPPPGWNTRICFVWLVYRVFNTVEVISQQSVLFTSFLSSLVQAAFLCKGLNDSLIWVSCEGQLNWT